MFAGLAQLGAGIGPGDMFAGLAQLSAGIGPGDMFAGLAVGPGDMSTGLAQLSHRARASGRETGCRCGSWRARPAPLWPDLERPGRSELTAGGARSRLAG